MAIQYSDQFAKGVLQSPTADKKHPSEKGGAVRTANVTLNAAGSYAPGTTPAPVTYNNGDVVYLLGLDTNTKIESIGVLNSAAEASLTYDLGLYYGHVSGNQPAPGTVAKIDAYASNDADLQTVHGQPYELAFINRLPGAVNQYIWEDAGLSADPGGDLIIAITITAGTLTVAPDQVSYKIKYVNY